jgi:two-component system, LytTR family, sensor kinase
MKLLKPPKLELYSFLFSMPLIALVVNLILFDERLWTDAKVWWFSMPLIFVIGVISWYSHLLYHDSVEKKYPSLSQSRQRIAMKILVVIFVMMPSIGFIFLLYNYFHILGYQLKMEHIPKGMLVGVCVNIIFETLYEADYIFSKYKESIAEKEALWQLSVQQEFDTLKNQVNPHFLFNCFNTLSSLITVDKERAEVFLNDLSKVYRYLLRNNEEGTGTVENEIKFIESYFKLLQTRHGDAVQMNMQVDRQYNNYLLPSLSLQLLVENAVKHNALSKSRPLVIDIFSTAGNKIVVSNNLQRRAVKAASNGVGLQNIKAKYELLKQPGFQIIEDGKNFTAVLPVIWKAPVAATHR